MESTVFGVTSEFLIKFNFLIRWLRLEPFVQLFGVQNKYCDMAQKGSRHTNGQCYIQLV